MIIWRSFCLGNGVVTQTGFDSTSGRLSNIKSGRLSSANNVTNLYGDIQNLSYTFDSLGNLYSRTTARTDNNGLALENTTENFGYDKLNRLTTSTTNALFGRTQTYQYDTGGLGNLVNRSDILTGSSFNNGVGALAYDQVRNAGIHAVTSAGGINYSYDKYGNMIARGSESIIYDTFNKPTRIAGASITDFYYGPDHELYKEVSGTKTTYKLGGGVYEVIVDGTTTTQKSYVDGVIINNRVLTNGTQSANDTQYLHTDHLGSVEATTNALGQFVNRMSFGAWGERQKSDWKPGAPTESFLTTNGYTGHDQLNNHNLVHMGGRVYDPNLGRFLSADIYIQSPYDTQNYNRYSYVGNNPLSYIDPSGYSKSRSFGPGKQDLNDALEEVLVTGQYTNQDLMRQVNHSLFVSSYFSQQNSQAFMNSIVTEATAGLLYSQAIVNGGTLEWHGNTITVDTNVIYGTAALLVDELSEGALFGDSKDTLYTNAQIKAHKNAAKNNPIASSIVAMAAMAGKIRRGGATTDALRTASPHGNSKSSRKPQHIYSITDTRSGAIYKYGVSGSRLNQDGTSRRANSQVNLLNRTEGAGTFKASVLMTNIPNRFSALAIEKTLVYGYLATTGDKPAGNQRP